MLPRCRLRDAEAAAPAESAFSLHDGDLALPPVTSGPEQRGATY